MQITMFDGNKPYKINKPIRLIELFAGYGSQHFALKYIGKDVESWRICEWAVKSIQAYKDAHFGDDNTDYSKDLDFETIVEFLSGCGISADYNQPMTKDQIRRMGETKCRVVYNNIKATHNLVDISKAQAKDFDITETDKYEYVLTYSFPCQDLSKAGKAKGMARDSGTRSGLLWQVERILEELHSQGKDHLPQVLLMENVPDVIGTQNMPHFAQWLQKLESLGYHCYYECLNAKDYGVPQNRNRCFMVSILGDYWYTFPKRKPLQRKLKDLLEERVDESYYLSPQKIKTIESWNAQQIKDIEKEKTISPCLTARGAGEEHSGMILINEDAYNLGVVIKEKLYPLVKDTENYIQWKQEGYFDNDCRAWKEERMSDTITTNGKSKVLTELRIRKLTPKECFRLMGVKDNDFEKIAENQSNASLYHLAGDSIVVDVLMGILGQLI